jgi:outer membrane protein assembly factor BamB
MKVPHLRFFFFVLALVSSFSVSVAHAAELWNYIVHDGRIDTAAYIPSRNPAAYPNMVVVGVVYPGEGNQSDIVQAVSLNAATGDVLWTKDLIGEGNIDTFVISVQKVTDTNSDSVNDVVFNYRDAADLIPPGQVYSYVLNGNNGNEIGFSVQTHNSITEPAGYFQPIEGDFDGNGKMDNLLFRTVNAGTLAVISAVDPGPAAVPVQ